jgi:hypothetical protein
MECVTESYVWITKMFGSRCTSLEGEGMTLIFSRAKKKFASRTFEPFIVGSV